jgi:hypothetical protein
MDAGSKRMSAVPAAGHLAEFGPDGEVVGRRSRARQNASAQGGPEAAANTDAYAKGFEGGKAAAQAVFDGKLAEQKSRFEAQLASERELWVAQQGERLIERFQSGLRDLEETIAGTVGRILKPFLAAAIRHRAMAELQEQLHALLAGNEGIRFTVSGPPDLLEALRSQLDAAGVAVTYEPGQQCDVRVSVGETVLETRLGTWVAKIDEAVR